MQAAKRIVDEEKKAQSHLLAQKVVKSSTVIVAGTGSSGTGRCHNSRSTLVQVIHSFSHSVSQSFIHSLLTTITFVD